MPIKVQISYISGDDCRVKVPVTQATKPLRLPRDTRRHHATEGNRLISKEQPPPQIGGRIRPTSPIYSTDLLGF